MGSSNLRLNPNRQAEYNQAQENSGDIAGGYSPVSDNEDGIFGNEASSTKATSTTEIRRPSQGSEDYMEHEEASTPTRTHSEYREHRTRGRSSSSAVLDLSTDKAPPKNSSQCPPERQDPRFHRTEAHTFLASHSDLPKR